MHLFQLLIVVVAYNGGFRSFVTKFDDFEDVQVWQKIWNSSVPLWSILMSNFGILVICSMIIQSKRLFIKTPKNPVIENCMKANFFISCL